MLRHIVKIQTRTAQMRSERGATAVEYGLMVALIAVGIIGAVTIVGGSLNAVFTQIAIDPALNHPAP